MPRRKEWDWTQSPAPVQPGIAPGGWYFELADMDGNVFEATSVRTVAAAEEASDRHRKLVRQHFTHHPDAALVYLTTWDGDTGRPSTRAWYERDDVGLPLISER